MLLITNEMYIERTNTEVINNKWNVIERNNTNEMLLITNEMLFKNK